MRIGFVALGRMGSAMARRLLEGGLDVTVFNRTAAKSDALAAAGAKVAKDLAALCGKRDLVITMLPSDAALLEVALGEGGLAETMAAGTIHMACGTHGVAAIEKVNGGHGRAGGGAQAQMRGEDHHARIELDLIDAYRGAERSITLRGAKVDEQGHVVPQERTLQVSIPKGVKEGQMIRLAGQGSPGFNGGPAGDLFLEVHFQPDARWRIEGRDVTQKLRVTPWEAALGGGVQVNTPDGATVEVTVPAGSGGGRKLRLKGRGIPAAKTPGDLYLELEVAVPGAITDEQKAAWTALRDAYPGFDPRRA